MIFYRAGRSTVTFLGSSKLASTYSPITPLRSAVVPPPVAASFTRHAGTGHESSSSYAIRPPMNWGVGIVPEKKAYIIERFGKYVKTHDSGIHLLIPFMDRMHKRQYRFRVSLRLQRTIFWMLNWPPMVWRIPFM